MSRAGFDNWNPPASLQRIRDDVESREVYVMYADGNLIATITAATEPTIPYTESLWASEGQHSLYVNRLAVHPDHQGSGVGARLTAAMEGRALELGCGAVRLDALAENEKLIRFYERAGYETRFERSHSGWRFACMEKVLR